MKKALKVIGYALAGLILIVVLAALLIRFVFKEQMIAYVSKIEEKERIDLLRYPRHTLPTRYATVSFIGKTRFRHKRYMRISVSTPY
ncbi:hypothetical protein [Phocaeicola salanitronis]|uniref:hypothetical protein n=1 Tax=Phocaeicola salanitronis TaxID=376805 RepID=UPI003207A913